LTHSNIQTTVQAELSSQPRRPFTPTPAIQNCRSRKELTEKKEYYAYSTVKTTEDEPS